MIQIISRPIKNSDKVSLSARMFKRGVINNAISLGIVLTVADWQVIDLLLKNATEAEKSGNTVCLRDSLAISLWEIKHRLDVALEGEWLTVPNAKDIITEVLHQDVIEERERQQEREDKQGNRRYTLKEWIREYIRQCESGERLKHKSTRKITPGTIKNYKASLAQLEAYEAACHKIIDFDDVTMNFYDSYKAFFIRKQYSPNTIGRHVKALKTFLFAADDMKLTTNQDFKLDRFCVDRADVDNVYLTEERLQQMYDLNLMDVDTLATLIDKLPEKERQAMRDHLDKEKSRKALSEAKDVFLVGCFTGQRVSDYKRINSDMIVKLKDSREYISLRQEKTDKDIYIPLDPRVKEILQKYDGKLPKMYDQKINVRIKIIGHLLGWTEKAGITELHGTLAVDKGKRFYECIKTHTARRTFATNAYKNGIALSSIMAVTGHASESQLRKYLKLDNKERAMLAAQDFDRVQPMAKSVSL